MPDEPRGTSIVRFARTNPTGTFSSIVLILSIVQPAMSVSSMLQPLSSSMDMSGSLQESALRTVSPVEDCLRDGNTEAVPCFSAPVYRTNIHALDGKAIALDFDCMVSQGFFKVKSGWGCYRRNYMTVQASLIHPRVVEDYFILNRQRLINFAFQVSAVVADEVDKPVALIQHTPKRDKGPQQVPLITPVSWQDPEVIWGRLQYKTATSNNGKKKGQQRFSLKVTLLGCSQSMGMDCWVALAERYSEPMIVRGRSPGHYNDASVLHTSSRNSNRRYRNSSPPVSSPSPMNADVIEYKSEPQHKICLSQGQYVAEGHKQQMALGPNLISNGTFGHWYPPIAPYCSTLGPGAVIQNENLIMPGSMSTLAQIQGSSGLPIGGLPTYHNVGASRPSASTMRVDCTRPRESHDLDAAMLLASMSDVRSNLAGRPLNIPPVSSGNRIIGRHAQQANMQLNQANHNIRAQSEPR